MHPSKTKSLSVLRYHKTAQKDKSNVLVTSMARYVKPCTLARLLSVALLNWHMCFPWINGPRLMDTQSGSI